MINTRIWSKNDIFYQKGMVLLHKPFNLIGDLLRHFHCTPAIKRERVHNTLIWIKVKFWWKGMKKDIVKFVRECIICQYHKYDATKPSCHLLLLPMPTKPWTDINMNFIEALPKFEEFPLYREPSPEKLIETKTLYPNMERMDIMDARISKFSINKRVLIFQRCMKETEYCWLI